MSHSARTWQDPAWTLILLTQTCLWGSRLQAPRLPGEKFFMALPQLQDPINPGLFTAAPKSQHIFSYNPEPGGKQEMIHPLSQT